MQNSYFNELHHILSGDFMHMTAGYCNNVQTAYIGNNNSSRYFWELLCRKMVKNDSRADNGRVRINIIWVSMYNISFHFYVPSNKFPVFTTFNSSSGKVSNQMGTKTMNCCSFFIRSLYRHLHSVTIELFAKKKESLIFA